MLAAAPLVRARFKRAALSAALVLSAALAPATRAEPAAAWDPARTTSPETVDELKALQEKVKQVVSKVTPSTVGLLVNHGAGSGVIVSEDGLILTAAHVIGRPGQSIDVVLSYRPTGGRKAGFVTVKGKALGVNPKTDGGMARITDKPPADAPWPGAKDGKWPAAPIGTSADLQKGQWVVSLGHPGGPKPERNEPPVRVGRFENYIKNDTAIRSDCNLVGGDSGGPLFDLTGKVVGIHSRIGLYQDANYHVPTEAFREEWDKLSRGDAVPPKAGTATLGVTFDDDADTPLIKEVTPDSPAAKAGFQSGDVVLTFNDEKVHIAEDVMQLVAESKPGETVSVVVLRSKKRVTLEVTLGKRAPKRDRNKE